ncbi:MAG: Hpt domain-containing protein [Mariprofundus sp.]
MLLEFVKQFSDPDKQIRALLNQGDLEQIEQLAHCIKGSAGSLSTGSFHAASQLDLVFIYDQCGLSRPPDAHLPT